MSITVEEIFRNLSYSHLSGLALSNMGTGTIQERDYGKVSLAVNNTLIDLSQKFDFAKKRVIIRGVAGRQLYPLDPRYAVSAQDPMIEPFIMDTVQEPFTGDVAAIRTVWDAAMRPIPLTGGRGTYDGVWLTDNKTIRVPRFPYIKGEWSVEYRSVIPLIDLNNIDLCHEVNLSQDFWPALYYGAAEEIFKSMAGMENVAIARTMREAYDALVAQLTLRDPTRISHDDVSEKFESRGFP